MSALAQIDDETYARWNQKLNRSWSSANYARIGVTLQIVGETLAEAAAFTPGSNILDIAAGNGNASLALARRFRNVTSTDYVEDVLDHGRARAEAEDLNIRFETADAQALHYGDNSFDGVISTFGVMFAPNQGAAARELVRVCKPGGRIALTAWTPQGYIGRICATIGRHMGAGGNSGFKSPQNWGREEWLLDQFGKKCTSVSINWRQFNFRYRSPEHYLEYNRVHYGLMNRAFKHVGPEGEEALAQDILDIANRFNVATDGSLCAPSEYAEVILTK